MARSLRSTGDPSRHMLLAMSAAPTHRIAVTNSISLTYLQFKHAPGEHTDGIQAQSTRSMRQGRTLAPEIRDHEYNLGSDTLLCRFAKASD